MPSPSARPGCPLCANGYPSSVVITEAGVPGLSKIPGLGWLFKSKSINRKNTELLIFITPRISAKAEMPEDNA